MERRIEKDSAVSPIVATLVLIVVAVVGAVAVGTIMGAFSSDVSEKTNAGDVASASATEIVTAGSTTVLPASELLAKAYMAKNPGVKITVQGGGSGAGIAAVGNGIVDIGAASRTVKSDELAKFPDLVEHVIGGSAVVVIMNNEATAVTNLTKANLLDFFKNANDNGIVRAEIDNGTLKYKADGDIYVKVYQRQETSGTEETFAEYLGDPYKSAKNLDASKAVTAIGNQGILDAIAAANGDGTTVDKPFVLGFVDWGYYKSADKTKVHAPKIDGFTIDEANVKDAVKMKLSGKTSTKYSTDLARGLYYITKGEPSALVKNFITFAQSPEGSQYIDQAGMFGNAALA